MSGNYPSRPWLIVGTVPDPAFPLTISTFRVQGRELLLGETRLPVERGTPALAAAAAITTACAAQCGLAGQNIGPDVWQGAWQGTGQGAGHELLFAAAGDTGTGEGSRLVYDWLVEEMAAVKPAGLTFHYLLPDVNWHGHILMEIEELEQRPCLVADAGFMYAAKMSGYADSYDLFTPDIGELAFLADPKAPHPFYTRDFLLADESMAGELIARALAHGNTPRNMLVKGKTDRLVMGGEIVFSVDSPDIPMLEPVGGTGDTVTGIVTALLALGLPMRAACTLAMRANRRMGELANPTPASSVADLLDMLPRALLDCGLDKI